MSAIALSNLELFSPLIKINKCIIPRDIASKNINENNNDNINKRIKSLVIIFLLLLLNYGNKILKKWNS